MSTTPVKANALSLREHEPLASNLIIPLDQIVQDAYPQKTKSRLVPLRTKAEITSVPRFIDVFIVRLAAKNANNALRLLDTNLPPHALDDLQHLRRIAKIESLPSALKARFDDTAASSHDNDGNHFASTDKKQASQDDQKQASTITLYLLACPTMLMTLTHLAQVLTAVSQDICICTTRVPSTPPASLTEATACSVTYWPTIYKAHNPFGPQPVDWARASAKMEAEAELWMDLARKAGESCHVEGKGERFGAVIVDTGDGVEGCGKPFAVAAAGDARWSGCVNETQFLKNGNGAAHATLRAIAMVARQRKLMEKSTCADNVSPSSSSAIFLDEPITSVENVTWANSSLRSGGYLCTGLQIWLTHEPCLMCSMAILHSRFDIVVFAKRMRITGGLAGEGNADILPVTRNTATIELGKHLKESAASEGLAGLGYGLFWRPELNWKMLCWQWVDNAPTIQITEDGNIEDQRHA